MYPMVVKCEVVNVESVKRISKHDLPTPYTLDFTKEYHCHQSIESFAIGRTLVSCVALLPLTRTSCQGINRYNF